MSLPKFDADQSPADFEVLLAQARKASDLLKALSHESRLLILCLLAEGEKSVSELEEIMNMPQAAVRSGAVDHVAIDAIVHGRPVAEGIAVTGDAGSA